MYILHTVYTLTNWRSIRIYIRIYIVYIYAPTILQGGEDSQDPLSLWVIFRKSDLCLVALLWKMICNLGDPMSLRHPVEVLAQGA